jgi:hypothetical protein
VRKAIEFFIQQSRWRNESWTWEDLATLLLPPPPSSCRIEGNNVVRARKGVEKGWVTIYKGTPAQSNGCEKSWKSSRISSVEDSQREIISLFLSKRRLLIRLCSTSLSHSHLTELPHSKR